jgi:transposase-like protein
MKHRENGRYSKEERLRILKEIESGKISLHDAARKYDMSPSGIQYWKIQFGMRKPWGKAESARLGVDYESHDRALERQVEELKIQLANLYLENEFLKKAQDFSKRQKKLDTSIITDQNLSDYAKRVR